MCTDTLYTLYILLKFISFSYLVFSHQNYIPTINLPRVGNKFKFFPVITVDNTYYL